MLAIFCDVDKGLPAKGYAWYPNRLIPIRDIKPRSHWPWANVGLLAACGGVFLYEVSSERNAARLVAAWGFVPDHLTDALTVGGSALQVTLLTLVSAQFVHGGWIHVIGNLVYLRVFGDKVEEVLGSFFYPLFFIIAGGSGLLAQYAFAPESTVPIIGASGGIAGVLGLYIILFPTAHIVTLFPVLIFLTFVEVPAALFLGVWAAQQFLNGFLAIDEATDQVAWFAHLGGFGVGVALGLLIRFGRWLAKARRRQLHRSDSRQPPEPRGVAHSPEDAPEGSVGSPSVRSK